MRLHLVIRRPYGAIRIEGDSVDELVEGLEGFPEWLAVVDKLVAGTEEAVEMRASLKGIIAFSSDGPLLTVPRKRLSDKEAIGLLLFAQDPRAQEPRAVHRLLVLCGHPSVGYGARLSEMRRQGLVFKEGKTYRLSYTGKNWVKTLIQKLSHLNPPKIT